MEYLINSGSDSTTVHVIQYTATTDIINREYKAGGFDDSMKRIADNNNYNKHNRKSKLRALLRYRCLSRIKDTPRIMHK